MSILIKGMEMPTDGEHITIHIYSDGGVRMQNSNYGGWRAVPVPPHGELIDKNDLDIYYREEQAWSDYEQNRDNEYLEGVKDGLHEAAKQLSIAPIVIEAELPVHHGTFAAWSEEEALKRIILPSSQQRRERHDN